MTYVGVPRRCGRCGAELHGTAQDQPHACKDVARRLARQQRQISAVSDILREHGIGLHRSMVCAEKIVKKLNNMGISDD